MELRRAGPPKSWKIKKIKIIKKSPFGDFLMYNILMNKVLNKKKFSIIARARSFVHAFRGLGIILRTQHNAWVHLFFAIVAICAGFYFHISSSEWFALIISTGFVLVAEAFNTAMEIDIDLTSPDFHPYARDTKDVAAGAVLISVIVSAIIGIIIFLPKIILILK